MEDEYIRLLKAAREDLRNQVEGLTFADFKVRMKDYKIRPDMMPLYRSIYGSETPPKKLDMNLDAYMMLLEYEELNHALRESLQARKEAKWAIWISIFVGVIPVLLWLFDQFKKC